jgi:hypothetical protein
VPYNIKNIDPISLILKGLAFKRKNREKFTYQKASIIKACILELKLKTR